MDDFFDWIPFITICIPSTTSVLLTSLKSSGAPIPISMLWCALGPFVVIWGIFLAFIAIFMIVNMIMNPFGKHK